MPMDVVVELSQASKPSPEVPAAPKDALVAPVVAKTKPRWPLVVAVGIALAAGGAAVLLLGAESSSSVPIVKNDLASTRPVSPVVPIGLTNDANLEDVAISQVGNP